MVDFIPELLTLEAVLFERKSFQDAYFQAVINEKLSTSRKNELKERIIGVFRHFQSLSFESLDLFSNYNKDSDEHILSIIALYVLRYEKRTSYDDFSLSYKETFLRLRLSGDYQNNITIIHEACLKPFAVKDEVKSSPCVYNSLVLEVPDFLLKKLTKDFSGKKAFDIALSLRGKLAFYYQNLSDKKIEDERLIKLPYINAEIYKSNKVLPSSQLKSMSLSPISYLSSYLFELIPLKMNINTKILLNGCSDNGQFIYWSKRFSSIFNTEIVPVYYDTLLYRNALDYLKHNPKKGVSPLLTESKLIKTYLPYDENDLVICNAMDSKVGLARRKSEILPSLREKDFPIFVKRCYEQLVDSSLFVKKGGYLGFISYSFDKDETISLINKFLNAFSSFELVKEEYLLASDNSQEGGYIALLRRKDD